MAGVPALVQQLRTSTSPEAVVECLVTGPLAGFTTVAGFLMHGVGDLLVMVGTYGYSPEDLAGFEAMPVTANLPICQAYREGEVVVTSQEAVRTEYSYLDNEPERWAEVVDHMPLGSIVSVPLVSQGVAIGAFGFSCTEERTWGPESLGFLDGLSSILAIWMSHPISGFAPEHPRVASHPVALSERQRHVLRLSSEGLSTTGIADRLVYSESTVKQELRRAMRQLETRDRATAITRARMLGLLDGGGR